MATAEERRETDSGIEVKPVYTADDLPAGELELPGEYPFTRGPYSTMYRGRPWTMRQYAGYGSAEESNARFRYLLERGQTGLSVAFDLPTQLGYDADDPLAVGEVGRTGVAIDSIADMEVLLEGIPLGEVSTSMTINAPAALLLLLYELVAESQGVPGDKLRGTVQNDVLKEYIARGNYIFPPRPSMRLTTDLFAYCAEGLPGFNTISISGYHIREAGASAAQELAFTLANGIAYCEAAVAAGLSPDAFGERLSFFFNAHNHFFQEVAKFRAARRLWARIMSERFGATNPRATALRFHAQTGGSTLTAQQPENNVVRVAIQALSAIAGGAQSIHTNSYDEALALPSERAARIALRTQQILAHEAGGTDTADPLGGAYFIEALTDELETRAQELIERIDEMGGAVAAIEAGFVQAEIEASAFRHQAAVEAGERVVVGVNRFTEDDSERVELLQFDPESERRQRERTARVRAERDAAAVEQSLSQIVRTAESDANLLPALREALRVRATVGEICGVLRELWGTYDAQHA
jgi:methylmalonyl-CoA mutase N-terminal domain/subunit